jgi:hypothetical protein
MDYQKVLFGLLAVVLASGLTGSMILAMTITNWRPRRLDALQQRLIRSYVDRTKAETRPVWAS